MITQLRVVTTHGSYTSTLSAEDRADATRTLDRTSTEAAEVLGGTGSRDFKLKIDGVGWVAFNPNHIVTIEFVEEQDF
jgi:hypothetical protein